MIIMKMLNERYDGSVMIKQVGLARELARMNLTLNLYAVVLKTDLKLNEFFKIKSYHMHNMK